MSIEVNVKSTIYRPVSEVFDAIVNTKKITGYFVSDASENIASGKTITWEFKDYDVAIHVDVLEVVSDRLISFRWSASGEIGIVNICLEAENDSATNIKITEGFVETNKDLVQKAMQQTQGWTDFICCLKAYLYTGINLRNGKYN